MKRYFKVLFLMAVVSVMLTGCSSGDGVTSVTPGSGSNDSLTYNVEGYIGEDTVAAAPNRAPGDTAYTIRITAYDQSNDDSYEVTLSGSYFSVNDLDFRPGTI